MSDIQKRLSNLDPFYDDEVYLQLTFLQLKKDLAHLFPEDDNWIPNSWSKESMLEHFSPLILELINHRKSEFVQFLYRIDIGENVVVDSLESGSLETGAKNLTLAIIDRELKKVITRKFYSE